MDGHKKLIAESVFKVLETDLQQCVGERLYTEGKRPDVELEVTKISDLQSQIRVTWPGTHRRYFVVKLTEML